MMANIPSFILNNGTKIPALGIGCWMGSPGGSERVYQMCLEALKCGYRHFDTAAGYGNEVEVGCAIRDSGIPRDEIYLTTKLLNSGHRRVKEAFEESLKKLDVGYIDLYLMTGPKVKSFLHLLREVVGPEEHPTSIETWKAMEQLLQTSKVKTIGVSNFSIKTLEHLLPHSYCDAKNILLTAYSPLGGQGTFFAEDTTVQALAQKLDTSPAQIVIRWAVQRGTIAIPKSENKERMRTNISLVPLSAEDMKSLLPFHDESLRVYGWTYEQLGWNMVLGGVVPAA
ncbi:aldo/keto reductase [Mycena metata]|uniref:Aldo/keto reductase n=1 Tax=Mycena metata TaxID=1033252 RepID=A0AAD7IVK8_9AGAR|nr:aldo/keto reductase [Mycena metata]